MNLFAAVEVINGGQIMFSSAKFWDAQLRDGNRLAAIGGSDSHNATHPPGPPGSIGWPTTAVEADELSVPAILNGIRAGRTFVDLTASHDKAVDFEAESAGSHARMGGTLRAAAGAPIHVQIHLVACAGDAIHLLMDGEETAAAPPLPVDSAIFNGTATLTANADRHWLRVEVRDSKGNLQLLSSPLYINFPVMAAALRRSTDARPLCVVEEAFEHAETRTDTARHEQYDLGEESISRADGRAVPGCNRRGPTPR